MRDPQEVQELVEAQRYEAALGVGFGVALPEVGRAVMLLAHAYQDNLEAVESLHMAEAELKAERGKPDKLGTRCRIVGVELSKAGHKIDSLQYLRKAVELLNDGYDYHWLGSTLVQVGQPAGPFRTSRKRSNSVATRSTSIG
jgi:hypothetical protein